MISPRLASSPNSDAVTVVHAADPNGAPRSHSAGSDAPLPLSSARWPTPATAPVARWVQLLYGDHAMVLTSAAHSTTVSLLLGRPILLEPDFVQRGGAKKRDGLSYPHFPVIVWRDAETLMVEGSEDRRTCTSQTSLLLVEHLVGEWAGPLEPPPSSHYEGQSR